MKILSRIQTALLYPMARTIVGAQSVAQRLRTLGKAPRIHFEAPYGGEPILLLALYQKGRLRPDLVRLLQAAKAQGLYVLAVNTLKVKAPEALAGFIDCYIERPNFGRDFGSYKTGFLHLYRRGWDSTCPRLLMVNDSVYYSTRGLAKFLQDLATSEIEVLGATENFEEEYHLGSFCISMAGSVLRHENVIGFWSRYRLSDLRPTVINRGEKRLSRVLRRSIQDPSQFEALFNNHRILELMRTSRDLQESVIKDSRTNKTIHWPRFEVSRISDFLDNRFLVQRNRTPNNSEAAKTQTPDSPDETVFINGRDALRAFLLKNVTEDSEGFDNLLTDTISAVATEVFMVGSQIHQNAALLLEIGLPIVKLDGVYRGVLNTYDVLTLTRKLDAPEASELAAALLSRPFGGSTLIGWRRSAFNLGLI